MVFVQRILAALLGLVLLVALFIFASVIVALAAAVGIVAWLWLRYRYPVRHDANAEVIEGEYRDVTELERLETRERKRL